MKRILLVLLAIGLAGWREAPTTDTLTGATSMEYGSPAEVLDGPRGMVAVMRMRCIKQRSIEVFVVFSQYFSSKNPFWTMAQDGAIVGTMMDATIQGQGRVSFAGPKDMSKLLGLLSEDRDFRLRVWLADGPQVTLKPDMRRGAEAVKKVREDCKA